MAEVSVSSGRAAGWSAAQTRAQFTAIARLRYHIFRNGLRRKGGIGDLIANLVMVPLFLAIIFFPTAGAGVAAWFCITKQQPVILGALLWAIFGVCQFTSIQLGQPSTTFDPTQLIRFPLNFPGYAAVRVFFGLVSPANIVGVLMSFATAVGITVAAPGLWFYAFTAMAVFALCNVFFTRMLFSWVDRWLSTRRAREIFTGTLFALSIGVQYLNASFNPGLQHGHAKKAQTVARVANIKGLYHHAEPVLALLPPGLTTNGILAAQHGALGAFTAGVLGTLLFTALFFTVFAFRLHKEFRGENLSDSANAVVTTKPGLTAKASSAGSPALHNASAPALPRTDSRFSAPPTVSAVFAKEFLYLRRNTGMFYGLVAPLAMVIIFAGRLATHTNPQILFPAAVAYTMLGIAPLSYNSLGVEAAGIQFYFLAPVSMRDVFLGKNLFNAALAAAEIFGVFAVVSYVARPPSVQTAVSVLLWSLFTLCVSMAVGNYRSVTSPKKIEASKLSGKQSSPLSVLIGMGVLLVCSGLGAAILFAAAFYGMPWLPIPSTLLLAVIGYVVYQTSLRGMDGVLARKRDTLSEVLCKG